MEHCSECGYDLTGLGLPHICPECGRLADRAAERAAAVAWYRSWRGLLFWRPPPEAARYLDDPRAHRVAARRLVGGAILPWLLASSIVFTTNGIYIESRVRDVWYIPGQPGLPMQDKLVNRVDRLLNLNFDLSGAYVGLAPPGLTERWEVHYRKLRFGLPDPDEFALIAILTPTAAFLPIALVGLVLLILSQAVFRLRPVVVPILLGPYAFHFVVGLVLLLLTIPMMVLGYLDKLTGWAEYVAGSIGWLGLALLAVGPARLLVHALRACGPRQSGLPTILMILAFTVMLPVPVVIWLAFAWLTM